jgi:SPP1 gp7 family putative phage head morphogenesis protein
VADILEIADAYRRALLRKERKAAVRLIETYGTAWARLERELAKLTAQIAEARAKGEPVNQFWLARQQRYGDLLRRVGEEMRKFSDAAEIMITKQQSAAAKAGLRDSVALMSAAVESAGVRTAFNKLPVAAVENMVGFLGDGSPLRSLLDQIPRSGRAIVEQGLIEGVALGRNPRAIASQIREGLGGNMVRALTIARTEMLRAYRTASHQAYQANADVLTGWVWRSSRSRRSCAACIALDGTFFPLAQPMRPHPRCRCTMIPAVRGVEVDRGVDWFKQQSADVKRSILGTDKAYEAIKRGDLKLEDLVGLQRSAQWGDSYVQIGVKRALAGEGRFPGNAPKPAVRPTVPPMPAPPPPAPRQPMPAGKPVADGLKLPSRGALAQIGKHTLAAIEKVHGDGDLPQIPLELERSNKRLGGYWYTTASPSRALKITIKTREHPELTLAHEIGHFLDQQGAGKGRGHASPADALFDEFRQAAKNSRAIRDIETYLSTGKSPTVARDSTLRDLPVKRQYAQYLLLTHEIWARAYSQYIAIRSGDAVLMRQLDELRGGLSQKYYPSQWEDDDFQEITEVIDRLMIALGWRK